MSERLDVWCVFLTTYKGPSEDWRSCDAKPCFYVHGSDAARAQSRALLVVGVNVGLTSGSVVRMNANLDPVSIDPGPEDYFSWQRGAQ